MSRFEFGPEIGTVTLVAPGPDATVTKQDVQVAFAGVDGDGNFSFSVPAYNPASFNTLMAVHVALFENNEDGTAPTLPTDPALAVQTPLSYSIDTSTLQGGGDVVVDATEAPEGDYTALAVLEFNQ